MAEKIVLMASGPAKSGKTMILWADHPDQPWRRSRDSRVGKKNWPEVVLKESIVEDRN